MAKWNEYGLKSGTSAEDEVLILDSDTNTNKRTTVGDIQEFANRKMLEKENPTLNTEAKDLIGAINEVDAKNDAQDTKIEEVENKFSDYLKKTDVDSTLSVSGSPADAKVVGEQFKKSEEAITDLVDKKITKFYASNQGNTHLPDSDKGKIQDMFLYGKSEQMQYKGKNLIQGREVNSTLNGITCKYNGDGTYTVNGTATADAFFIIYGNFADVYGSASSLRLVGCPSGGSAQKYFLRGYRKDGSPVNSDEYGSGIAISSFEETGSNIAIIVRSGVTVSNIVFKPMLTTDTTATYADYEPYVGGIPSPNPDYPQEIKAVVNPKVVVRGKNLLNATLGTETENGVTCTANGDGTYTVNGTATGNTYFYLSKKIKLNKSFRVIGCPSGGSTSTYYLQCLMQEDNVWEIDTGNGVNVTVNEVKNFDHIAIAVKKDYTANNIVFKPMLTTDLNATYDDYEPYTEQTVTLPYTLYAIPVTSGGNITIGSQQYVADYVDVERGKLVRMCKEIDFAKTKQALYDNSLTNTKESRYRYKELNLKVLADSATYENGAGYVNRAFLVNTTWGIDRDGIFSHGQGTQKEYVTLRIPKDKDAREYFTEIGGCKGVFIAATPEEIDLTPEEISAFKALFTNYPVTNIEVSSDQLDGYTVFNYPISMAEGWNYVKQQIGDTRDYIYDMDLQSAEAYVNSEYAVALTELEVM